MTSIKSHNSVTNLQKMMCKDPDLDLVNIYAYTKFGKILSIFFKILRGKFIMMDKND